MATVVTGIINRDLLIALRPFGFQSFACYHFTRVLSFVITAFQSNPESISTNFECFWQLLVCYQLEQCWYIYLPHRNNLSHRLYTVLLRGTFKCHFLLIVTSCCYIPTRFTCILRSINSIANCSNWVFVNTFSYLVMSFSCRFSSIRAIIY